MSSGPKAAVAATRRRPARFRVWVDVTDYFGTDGSPRTAINGALLRLADSGFTFDNLGIERVDDNDDRVGQLPYSRADHDRAARGFDPDHYGRPDDGPKRIDDN